MRSGWNRDIYKAGTPTIAIMKITGHKSEKVFMDYVKVTGEENAQMLKDNPSSGRRYATDYTFVLVLYPILLLGVSV